MPIKDLTANVKGLTEKNAAQLLGVSTALLRKWRRKTDVGPCYFRLGRCIRYRLVDIDSFVRSRIKAEKTKRG